MVGFTVVLLEFDSLLKSLLKRLLDSLSTLGGDFAGPEQLFDLRIGHPNNVVSFCLSFFSISANVS
jgi:hypothetical protein